MKLNQIEIRLVKDLYKSENGLYTFTLFNKLKISISELFAIINLLVDRGVIIEKDDRVFITEKGRAEVLNQNLISKGVKSKYDVIPDRFLGPRIAIDELYFPNYKDVLSELLTLKNIKEAKTKLAR